jgi:membrane protein DedA with SNARE-associated domain
VLIASIFSVASNLGYPALILLVMAESGGIPVPGETALLTAGILASSGKLSIVLVIVFAATGAIVGDNIGYVIGRVGGRYLLERPGPFSKHRQDVLRIGEPFFEKHGPKAVFFGRFIIGLRTWASWLAGATKMHWLVFATWNAIGGIVWATVIGLLAYYVGHSVESVIKNLGLFALPILAILGIGIFIVHRRLRASRSLVTRVAVLDFEHKADEPTKPA